MFSHSFSPVGGTLVHHWPQTLACLDRCEVHTVLHPAYSHAVRGCQDGVECVNRLAGALGRVARVGYGSTAPDGLLDEVRGSPAQCGRSHPVCL